MGLPDAMLDMWSGVCAVIDCWWTDYPVCDCLYWPGGHVGEATRS